MGKSSIYCPVSSHGMRLWLFPDFCGRNHDWRLLCPKEAEIRTLINTKSAKESREHEEKPSDMQNKVAGLSRESEAYSVRESAGLLHHPWRSPLLKVGGDENREVEPGLHGMDFDHHRTRKSRESG